MSRNTQRRSRDSIVRKWWMAIAGVGALAVVVVAQSSIAASNGRHEGTRTTTRTWRTSTTAPSTVTTTATAQGGATTTSTSAAALAILGNNCDNSKLTLHDGFQNGNRCVTTEFGEVADQDHNPSLIIAAAPRSVAANTAFDLRVSTRNLVRDRFLGAAAGGYYKESAFLNAQGLTRGHFHTACRILTSTRNAPDPAPAPAFFVATEDNGGGSRPDTVTVHVTGLPAGLAECAVWAGDGSHRVPMMQRANQIPAFDVVRIFVR
jgi:hypothetical protein